jgi:hypothetical protein
MNVATLRDSKPSKRINIIQTPKRKITSRNKDYLKTEKVEKFNPQDGGFSSDE